MQRYITDYVMWRYITAACLRRRGSAPASVFTVLTCQARCGAYLRGLLGGFHGSGRGNANKLLNASAKEAS